MTWYDQERAFVLIILYVVDKAVSYILGQPDGEDASLIDYSDHANISTAH